MAWTALPAGTSHRQNIDVRCGSERGRFLVQPALLAAEAIVDLDDTHDGPVFLTSLRIQRCIGSWRDHLGIAMLAGLVARRRWRTIAPMSVGMTGLFVSLAACYAVLGWQEPR